MTRCIVGVDPGRSKVGIAAVEKETNEILLREVVPCEDLAARLQSIQNELTPELIVIGNGTNSKAIQQTIRESLPGTALLIVDETDTTVHARELYWKLTPRRGWRRLLPSSLQVPPVPIDDYVAVILAQRALHVD